MKPCVELQTPTQFHRKPKWLAEKFLNFHNDLIAELTLNKIGTYHGNPISPAPLERVPLSFSQEVCVTVKAFTSNTQR